MRGEYEQQWQDALAGARVEPPAGLWENITRHLNDDQGRNGWLTLLLIAATVTIAFAFPLTLGDASFAARPGARQEISQAPVPPATGPAVVQPQAITSGRVGPPQRLATGQPVQAKKAVAGQAGREAGSRKKATVTPAKAAVVPVSGLGLADIDLQGHTRLASVDDYYLIPFYLPPAKTARRMMVSANGGAGSLNNGGGLVAAGGPEAMDMVAGRGSADFSVVAASRQENPGTTYYVGGGVALPLGKRWLLQTGIGFLLQRATGTSNLVFDAGKGYQPLSAYDPVVPGAVLLREPYEYRVTNNYLNVPLLVKYPIIDKKVKLRAGAGISADFMLAHTVSAEGFGTSNFKPSSLGYNPVVLAGLLNLDVSYDITNQYALAFETGWRRGFTAIDQTRTYYPASFTMGMVLFYQLR